MTSKRVLLLIGLLIVVWGSSSALLSQGRIPAIEHRVTTLEESAGKLETNESRMADKISSLTEEVATLKAKTENLIANSASAWNLQLTIAGGVVMLFIQGLITSRKKD